MATALQNPIGNIKKVARNRVVSMATRGVPPAQNPSHRKTELMDFHDFGVAVYVFEGEDSVSDSVKLVGLCFGVENQHFVIFSDFFVYFSVGKVQ